MADFEIDIEHLISLVEERPVLWDKTQEEYRDRNLTTVAWREICATQKSDYESLSEEDKCDAVKMIIKKWTNLRDTWMKWDKKHEEWKKFGSKTKLLRKYVYHERMAFLKKVATHRETSSSIIIHNPPIKVEIEENIDEVQTTVQDSQKASSDKKKRKYEDVDLKIFEALKNNIPERRSRHHSFFDGIIPILEKFDDDQIIAFQMGVLDVLKKVKGLKSDL